ncbi:hypothetical protein AMECASPLE_015068, partial [Ameca splendens]
AWVCSFEKPQTSPNSLSPSTTVLSPYITFGCLSARTFWWRLTEVYQGRKHSGPPVSLHGQLLWREFFYTGSVGINNFNKMEGNPVCIQVDWDTNPEYLAAWREVLVLNVGQFGIGDNYYFFSNEFVSNDVFL